MSALADKPSRMRLAIGLLTLAWVIAAAGPVSAWPLRTAALETEAGATCFHVAAADPGAEIPHDVFRLENPDRIVIDLFGADLPIAVQGLAAATGANSGLRDVRWSLWRDDPDGQIVRYVVETDGAHDCTLSEAPGDLRIFFRPVPTGSQPSLPTAPTGPASPLSALTAAAEPDEPTAAPLVPLGPGMAEGRTAPVAAAPVAHAEPAAVHPVRPAEQDLAPSLGSVDAGGAADAASSRPMNLDVQGADIRTVLRSIAEYGGANIVADREVEGPVTVRLSQVPWRMALDIVCRSAGLVAVDGDQVIRVAAQQTYQLEGIDQESNARKREDLQPLITKVYPIRYASAGELLKAIGFTLSKRGSASIDERTNSILVSDIEPRIEQVEGLINRLDTETRQVEIVARLVDVDKTVARQLGIDWTLDNLHSNSERISGGANVSEALSGAKSGQLQFGVVRDFGNLDAVIEAMEQNNQASLISNPKITTVNNRQARILVGKEVPLIILDEAGNATTQLKKVGITLEVTPYINSANKITMDLHPEVSDLSSQSTVQGGVVFNTTLADTRVMVNNGETAVIGGLLRQGETEFQQGIPILSSIPLIGGLFRSTDHRTENRELLIFVSPRIVEPMAEQQP